MDSDTIMLLLRIDYGDLNFRLSVRMWRIMDWVSTFKGMQTGLFAENLRGKSMVLLNLPEIDPPGKEHGPS